MKLMATKKHWLIGKKVVVIYDHVWKGATGLVKEVTQDLKALVAISSHTVYHANKLEAVPLRNLALDLQDSRLVSLVFFLLPG